MGVRGRAQSDGAAPRQVSHGSGRAALFLADQEDEHRDCARYEHERLKGQVVVLDDGGCRVPCRPTPGEDHLDENGAADENAEEDARECDDRRERGAYRLASEPGLGQPTRAATTPPIVPRLRTCGPPPICSAADASSPKPPHGTMSRMTHSTSGSSSSRDARPVNVRWIPAQRILVPISARVAVRYSTGPSKLV